MEMFSFKLHSVVDVITNSSTVIYTYQDGSVKPAKELINEMLKLFNVTDKTADDLFYFGVFAEEGRYMERLICPEEYDIDNLPEDCPKVTGSWKTEEYKNSQALLENWFHNIQKLILTGEMKKPSWMEDIETDDEYWNPDSYLTLLPKDEKYVEFGNKIKALLNSVSADGGRDG